MTELNRTEKNAYVEEFIPNFGEEFLDGMSGVKRELVTVHVPQWLYRSERDLLLTTISYCARDIRHLGRFLSRHGLRLVLTIDPVQNGCYCRPRKFLVIRDDLSASLAAMKILWLYAGAMLRGGKLGLIGLMMLLGELQECNAKSINRSPEYLESLLRKVGLTVHYTLAFDFRKAESGHW